MEYDFSTNEVIDSLDAVPDTFKGAYVEKDGKFAIADHAKGLVTAVTGLAGALKKERLATGQLKTQKDVGAALKEGLGFETIEATKAKIDELTAAVASKANVDPAKLRKEIEDTFATERQGLLDKNSKMQGTLEKYLITSTATSAVAEAKGKAALLMPVISSQVKVVEDNGEYVVRVVDGDGQYRGDGKGGFMGVAELVAELKRHADYGVAFESENRGGGGGGPGRQPAQQRQVPSQQDKVQLSPNSRLEKGLRVRRGG